MVSVRIKPSHLTGSITIPPSKSHTIRALFFALMAHGKSHIHSPLSSPDTDAMTDAICQFGAKVMNDGETLLIDGVGGHPTPTNAIIQCGNSGQVLRFMGALAALSPTWTTLTGDHSIRHSRPVQPLLSALNQLGASTRSTDGCAPIRIQGPLSRGTAALSGEDSQPVSGLLMLGAFTPLELHVINPGEKPWVALTLSWFERLGIPYENRDFAYYKMDGGARVQAFDYKVPGDFSSAAFPLIASLITSSEILLENLDLHDSQGDRAIIPVLESMGALFEKQGLNIAIKKSPPLRGRKIDINDFIDALPILAVAACFAESETEIVNGAIARRKESDRIHCMAQELGKMGADIEERSDGLSIRPAKLRGALSLQSHYDHRIAMALCVAALAADGESLIQGVECTVKSYPSFFDDFKKLGAQMSFE